MPTYEPRESIRIFSELMEKKLLIHDEGRGTSGWKRDTINSLFDRMYDELVEVQHAIYHGEENDIIADECADVANFAMMICDVLGELGRKDMASDGESATDDGAG